MMASSILIYDDSLIDEINSMEQEQLPTNRELFTTGYASLENEAITGKEFDLANLSNLNVDADVFVPRSRQNSLDFSEFDGKESVPKSRQTTDTSEIDWYRDNENRDSSQEELYIYRYLDSFAGYDLDNIFIFDIQFVNTEMSEICIWNNKFSSPAHINFPNKYKLDTEQNKRNQYQSYSNSSRYSKKRKHDEQIDHMLFYSLQATDPIAVSRNKTQQIFCSLEWALRIVNKDSIFVCRTNNRKDTTKLLTPSLAQNKIFHMQKLLESYNKTVNFMVFPSPLPKFGPTCVGHYRDNKKCALRNVCFILEAYFSKTPEMLDKISKQFTVCNL